MEEQNRGKEEVEYEEEVYIHKELWFTAGTALLMVCLKRAAVVSFIQQWRAWVFIILNIVLLAILFISIRSAPSEEQKETKFISSSVEVKVERKKMIRKECSSSPLVAAIDIDCKLDKSESRMDEAEAEEEVYEECVESAQLSKEELNARVEAFITMFRQHLVSDAKKFKCYC